MSTKTWQMRNLVEYRVMWEVSENGLDHGQRPEAYKIKNDSGANVTSEGLNMVDVETGTPELYNCDQSLVSATGRAKKVWNLINGTVMAVVSFLEKLSLNIQE